MVDNIKINVPKHVGIIMDGNRRWARAHGLPVIFGYKDAADKVIEPIIEKAGEMGISYLTFWAFSTENWERKESEIKGLMNVFRYILKAKLERFHKKGAKIKILGDMSKFPSDIRVGVEAAVNKTKNNKKINVNFAINYGGRDEIVRAANKIVTSLEGPYRVNTSEKLKKINEKQFSEYLDTAGQPDPDLIIRTGGGERLSGFLTWQSVYSELYFTDVLFPDFTQKEFEKAVGKYSERQRRYGK